MHLGRQIDHAFALEDELVFEMELVVDRHMPERHVAVAIAAAGDHRDIRVDEIRDAQIGLVAEIAHRIDAHAVIGALDLHARRAERKNS